MPYSSTWEAKARGLQVQGQLRLHSETLSLKRKEKKKNKKKNNMQLFVSFLSTHSPLSVFSPHLSK
jgi:hypothetical protein